MENPYDEEEDTRPIAIWFTDTPPTTQDMNPDTHIIYINNQDLDHTTNPGGSFNNTGKIDPDSDQIIIRITGVNDQVLNNPTINEAPVADTDNDDIDDIKQIGVDDHSIEATGVKDHTPNNNTEPGHEPWRSIRIQNQGVQQTNEEFEYIHLQDTFRDMEPRLQEETVVRIYMPNERQNYYSTMEFIVNEARSDQMIDDYILPRHSLKAGLRKFEEKGRMPL